MESEDLFKVEGPTRKLRHFTMFRHESSYYLYLWVSVCAARHVVLPVRRDRVETTVEVGSGRSGGGGARDTHR